MKFSYGISDFHELITQDYFYIDRSDRIPLIEEAGVHLLFLRPRRFGKTLLLSMLKNYYDIAKAGEFTQLFGNLNIGKNPTDLHNRFFVLKWDFSAVSSTGEPKEIQQALYRYVNGSIEDFALYYKNLLPIKIKIYPEDALASFQSLLLAVRQTSHKLYLLIDEYDNFANEVMMGSRKISQSRYKALVYGEGCLKSLFKVVKSATEGQGLTRSFITGVSPVVMSDITSGHNIAESIYLKPQFNDLCGFLETEIDHTLKSIVEKCGMSSDELAQALNMMKKYYNGYRFGHKSIGFIYNPTLAIYFMKSFQSDCEYPEEMLDENMAMDRGKITYISRLPQGGQVIVDALNDKKPLSLHRLSRRFGVEDMMNAVKDDVFMISLLYYFGVLTFGGRTKGGKHILKIPNLVVKRLYLERLSEILLPETNRNEASGIVENFYGTGDMKPVCDFIEQHCLKIYDNRDYRWANELTIKTIFLVLLFNDIFYITESENELERHYADMTMIVRPDMREYRLLDFLIEFKYVELAANELTGKMISQMTYEKLTALKPVKKKIAESKKMLEKYRRSLNSKHKEILNLRTFCVVAVGFDRLVWKEIK
ncbi:AAA family ATPase [Desulfobacterales bacterium HSG16]|nr:AAA family ATPase [Desulfobacterales bacterium HSG16]